MGIAILESKWILKNKVEVMVQVDDMRHVGAENDSTGLVAGTVEFLMPGVERYGEQGVFLPFDGLLRLAFVRDKALIRTCNLPIVGSFHHLSLLEKKLSVPENNRNLITTSARKYIG